MNTEDIDTETETTAMPVGGDESGGVGQPWSSTTDHGYADDLDDPPAPAPRPRRRLLTGVTALLAVGVVAAAGFYAGVQVQKHQGSSSSATTAGGANGFAAAFRRFGAGGAGGTGGAGGSGGLAAGGAGAAGGSATPTAGSETRTAGTVKLVDGTDVYVTEANGNTVLVTTDKATTMTKSATASVNDVKPGQTVVISGIQNKDGSIQGTSLSVGGSGGGFGLGGSGGTGAGGTGASGAGAARPNG
ncbi:MAG: hypothetical protein U0V73_09610 [Acidimicrobiia bacterium]